MRKQDDLHSRVTAKIIAAIESNPGEPTMPWRRSQGATLWPENALTQKQYHGINIPLLWAEAQQRGFSSNLWASYKQWQELGAQVRGGEKASDIVFFKSFSVEPDPDKEDDDGQRLVARSYAVFNACQVDNFAIPGKPDIDLGPIERIANADAFVKNTGAKIEHGGQRAYYRPSTDHIQMPEEKLFEGTATMTRDEGYYSVLVHELTHWTGIEKRCNRQFGKRFGDQSYAAEELVAELGSAMLCCELGITQDTREDHARYIASWLTLMKSDKKAIFTASAKASEAVTYLQKLQPGEMQMAA
jgi:antirestriction protein ArdC